MHITLTSRRNARLPLFVGEDSYREALHRLGAVCRGCLALFALVAEHLHLVALASRAAAGRLAQACILTLRPLVSTPFASSHITDVESRAHMRWLLRYILEQPIKHQMPGHPALWVGSCLPDLVGARLVEGLSLRITDVLPDYRQEVALGIVGLAGPNIAPADRASLRAAGSHRLVALAEAAFAGRPRLAGMGPVERRGRRGVIQLVHSIGAPRREAALALGMRPDSAERLSRLSRAAGRPPDREAMLTIARRFTLEERVLMMRTVAPSAPVIAPAAMQQIGVQRSGCDSG